MSLVSYPGLWLILLAVQGIKSLALIDTGASKIMMGSPLYQKVQKLLPLNLWMQEMPRLKELGAIL